MNELDEYNGPDDGALPEGMPEGMPGGFEGGLGDAFGSMMAEFQRAKLRNWFVRTTIGALLFGYLASQYSWAKWILYIWIPIAFLSLLAILFLPKILRNKVETMLQGGMQPGQNPFGAAFETGGFGVGTGSSFGEPVDVEGEIVDVESVAKVSLEEQLNTLDRYGVPLHQDRSIEDLLTLDDREAFEASGPYWRLLRALGSEMRVGPFHDGHPFSPRAWNLSPQGVEGDGYYVNLVKQLARIAGEPERVTEVQDFVDKEAKRVELRYLLDGEPRSLSPKHEGSMCDGETLEKVAGDLVRPGHGFYSADAGEEFITFYVSKDDGDMLDDLFQGDIIPIALGD